MKISFVKYEKESNYKIPKLLGMKVEEIQGDLAPLKKFWSFLSKKV